NIDLLHGTAEEARSRSPLPAKSRDVAQYLRADTTPERCEDSEHKEIVPLAYYNSACNVTRYFDRHHAYAVYLKSVLNVLQVRVTCYDRTWEGRGALDL
ncbi:hypothetical protein JG688_00010365, partial [Phytophthora aleatoria]